MSAPATTIPFRAPAPVNIAGAPDPVFAAWAGESLVWLADRGMGYYPVEEHPYDDQYYEKYASYARTALGRRLTVLRIELVARHLERARFQAIDVGIGCGDFIERAGQTWGFDLGGYDVNRAAVEWLTDRGLFRDPYAGPFDVATFFDSLEHIPDVHRILANVTGWVFASLPIVPEAAPRPDWKHYRKDEHVWYFTRDGFVAWMEAQGFVCAEHNTAESLAGREDIGSFAFRRAE